MNFRKLLCMVMAMLLALSALALAEEQAEPADLQAQLDAANARIAELEAEVEKYLPYYEMQVVAEYGDGGVIWLADAQTEYEGAASAYAQYGLSIDSYADAVKQQILESLVQQAVLEAKTVELGFGELDDETRAELEAEAAENFETYIENYKSYFAAEDATDEEAREQTIAAMAQYGLTQEVLTQQMIESYAEEQLHNFVTGDVTVSDDEVKAKYDAMIAADEAAYSDSDYSYNNARNDGSTIITWNPEGYRAVKHVLIKFDDEQSAQYSDLKSTLDSLNAEMEALEKPEEAPAAEADTDEIEPEGDAEDEPEAEPRSREEIQSDIGKVATEIEALYSQLLPKAQEVIDAFNAGTDFDALIEQYNDDPGMKREPAATNGYAVAANSTAWDPAFTEGAMSIEAPGQISAPIYGTNGIHIIYYMSDITPGAVPFEDVAEAVKAAALDEKVAQTYSDQIAAWVEEAHPVYHLDRF